MALQATYDGVTPRTQIPTAVALALGVRVAVDSNNNIAVAAASIRGEFTTLQSCEASVPCQVASMQAGGRVPALASESVVVGDPAYSAASGKYSKTSTNAVLVGKWVEAASADGVLGAVELNNPA